MQGAGSRGLGAGSRGLGARGKGRFPNLQQSQSVSTNLNSSFQYPKIKYPESRLQTNFGIIAA